MIRPAVVEEPAPPEVTEATQLTLDSAVDGTYQLPPDLDLEARCAAEAADGGEQRGDRSRISRVLEEFKIDAAVTGFTRGPTVTRYEVEVGPGVKVEAITRLTRNIAYAVASEHVRLLAPIPASLPSASRCPIPIARWCGSGTCWPIRAPAEDQHPLVIGLGKDVEGQFVSANLAKTPTCWWPAPPDPASRPLSTRCWSRCCSGRVRPRYGWC